MWKYIMIGVDLAFLAFCLATDETTADHFLVALWALCLGVDLERHFTKRKP